MKNLHVKTKGHDEWLTPPEIVRALGSFDLDPCSPICRPWDTAANHFNVNDDGLNREWTGRVWMNPPYGTETGKWLAKLAAHGNGIALIFARTETRMFFESIWPVADALCFIKGRIIFRTVDGKPGKHSGGAPSVLVAYGQKNALALDLCGLGAVVHLK